MLADEEPITTTLATTDYPSSSTKDETEILMTKVGTSLTVQVSTVNREYFVSKIFHAIIFHIK